MRERGSVRPEGWSRLAGLLRPRAAPAGHEAIGDAGLGEIVRRQFAQDLVADEHADAVLAHPACRVTQHFMTVLELDPEHRVRQQFHYLAAHLEEFFLAMQYVVPSFGVARP